MGPELRKTGIGVVGDVPWGAHFCHFYETKQDLLDTLIPYFKAGLESNEFCLWVVSDSDLITVAEAKAALGQAVPDLDRHLSDENIEILNGLEWYLEKNVFNLERVTSAWDAKLKRALARGYDGMRASGDTFWLAEKDWKDFFAYEKQINDWVTDQPMTVLCTYPLAKSGAAEVLDVVQAHQFAIARRQGEWEVIETPELIQAKAEIRRLNEELERQVIERTNELRVANEELRKEIGERKQAEDALRRSEDHLRLVIDTIPTMAWSLRPDAVLDFVSQRWLDYTGLSFEEAIEDETRTVHPEDLSRVMEKWLVVKDTSEVYEDEMRLQRADGEYRWFLVRIAPLLDEQGNLLKRYGVAIDIEERKQAEDDLRRQKEILQQIFDHIPVMISFVDADGRIKLVNHEWERTLGWSLEEIRQQNLDVFAECYPDPQDRQQVLKFVADAKGKWAEFKTRARDGRVMDTMFVRVQLSDGTRIGIGQDITERKQAEESLDERLRFETLVTELSAAFANLTTDEVDREIDKWLQTLAEFLGVDRASFFQFKEDWTTTLYRSHSYTVPGIEPLPPAPIGIKDQFPWITDQLRQGVTVKWSRIPDDMPEEATKEKEYAARVGAKSGLNIPVVMGGSVICAITFTSIATYRDWPDDLVARLRLVGEIFAAAVERKRAEAALRISEEQFRQLAENIREVFWLATADLSKMLYVSPAYEAVWGRTRESLYLEPRSFSAAIHDQDRARVVAIIERDREQGFEVEYRVVRPDGSTRWIRDRGFPIKDELGRFYRVAGLAEDVTERKRAEDDLRKQKEILQIIIDNIPVMIRFLGPDGSILVNRTWERTLGWSLEEVQQRNLDLLEELYRDPKDRRRAMDFITAATGEWADFKIHVRDGRVINATFTNIRLSDGTNISIGQDITERKRAEEARREAEQKYKDIFENAGEGIFQSTPDGKYIEANPALADMYGFASPEELIHSRQDISRQVYVDPTRREEFKQQLEQHGAVRGFEHEVFGKDGSRSWISVNARAVRDEQGAIKYYEGTAQDINERKAAEEKLKATSEQLRALSASLQSAREEEGSRIAREIHDELGSALTSLRWDLEGVEKICSEPEERVRVPALQKKVAAMLGLTDKTINIVRRIASELRPRVLDDLGLVEAITWQARQFQNRTGIVVQCESLLKGNDLNQKQSTAVFRIFQEALTNILRHAQATKVDVAMLQKPGAFVLTIRDNGRGITEDEKSGQHSIGLLGMRERAHLIGGEIDIRGSAGEGTTVTVRLPILRAVRTLKRGS